MNRIKAARLCKGLTQTELAKELGVTPVSVCKWESGDTFPKPGRLKDVAKALDTTVTELLPEDGKGA